MAKKNFYYVLVFTESGAKYVTKIPERNYAEWNELEKPLDFNKSYAEDIAIGLCLNGYSAVVVMSPYEITTQPYNYEGYELRLQKRSDKKCY